VRRVIGRHVGRGRAKRRRGDPTHAAARRGLHAPTRRSAF